MRYCTLPMLRNHKTSGMLRKRRSDVYLLLPFHNCRALVQRTKSSGRNPVYYVPGESSSQRHLFWANLRKGDGTACSER
jgi:hypothetical protein